MDWLQLHLHATHPQVDAIEDALLGVGAVSITFQDAADLPILEPGVGEMPLWPDLVVTGLFHADTPTEETLEDLRAQLPFALASAHWEILENRPWEREWLQHFSPLLFADRLWITPQGVELSNAKTEHKTLFLDPGLAFGTGTHTTTALCIEWIAECDWSDCRLIDYGCGSGILGLAAIVMGCPSVQAIDIDPQAIVATLDNAQRNQIDLTKLQVGLPDEWALTPADCLIANILAGPLIEFAPKFATLVKVGGAICLSGITESQSEKVALAYQPWFTSIQIVLKDGWARLSAIRTSAPLHQVME